MKRRGDRASLVLDRNHKSRSSRTEDGRACPPPTNKKQWLKGCKRVGKRSLAHGDGAAVYRLNAPSHILHDAAMHSSGKHGKKPVYAASTTHTLPDGSSYKAVSGTQSFDGHVVRYDQLAIRWAWSSAGMPFNGHAVRRPHMRGHFGYFPESLITLRSAIGVCLGLGFGYALV